MNHRLIQNRHGQGLVEYIIIIVASVGLISLVSLSMFGHKVADQHAIGFGMLPGACEDDNVAIATGFFAGVDEGASINSNGEVSWETSLVTQSLVKWITTLSRAVAVMLGTS